MASLRDIRKRVRSFKSTQQITKAMKMVSAAKLRRAQEALMATRPYSAALERVLRDITLRHGELTHPLLVPPPQPKRAEMLVMTSDRGLAGAFNSNILRRVSRFLYEQGRTYDAIRLSTVGRKGYEFFKRRGVEIRKNHAGLLSRVTYPAAVELADDLSAEFLAGRVDHVWICFNSFVSAISQRVELMRILPLQDLTPEAEPLPTGKRSLVDFDYEPSAEVVLDQLLPHAWSLRIWRALLESTASEHAARMAAMENATNNASDAIDRLSLLYNRTRQAAITKELMEIVSGAEALK
ncbi:MAG TPA: ATP synthase F1 subunit gamma [Myxococcaceae bacterium]|jgi:F-type H+-transporting ATPase subunit gamma|nr:ATP synthase F1 subunit gamma [Myxococcaceae bacterium]